MRLSAAILLCLMLTACPKVPVPPWQRWMLEGPPKGKEYHPLYVEGWKDGCHTGFGAMGNQYYRFFYNFKQDPHKAQNRIYYKGWKDAYDYCQHYVYMYDRRPFI